METVEKRFMFILVNRSSTMIERIAEKNRRAQLSLMISF
jgi:hypothetical protein